MKAIGDAIPGGARSGELVVIFPHAGQCPLVEVQGGWGTVVFRIILIESAGRGEIRCPRVPIVSALAKVVKTDGSRGVDKVIRRPVLVVETTPDLVVVIHRDRVGDTEI